MNYSLQAFSLNLCSCRIKLKLQGSKGPLACSAEVLPVVAGISMVEFQRSSGDHADYYQLYRLLAKAVQPTGPAKEQEESPRASTGVQGVQQRLDALTTGPSEGPNAARS